MAVMQANQSLWEGYITNTKIIIDENGANRMPLVHSASEYLKPGAEAIYRDDNVTTAFTSDLNDTLKQNGSLIKRDADLVRMEIALQATILYMAIFGNSLVLIVLKLRRQKLSRMQWLMVHLALADLFVCFFHLLPQLIWDVTDEFHGNDFLCRSVKYFQVVAMFASSYVLIMCAVDRYMSICHPLTSQTLSPNRVHVMIALAWSLSLLLSIPQIFIFRLVTSPNGVGNCKALFIEGWGLKAYVLWMFFANYAIPLLILAYCYGRICHVVWSRVASRDTGYSTIRAPNQENTNKRFRLRISFRRMRDNTNATVVCREGEDQHNSLMAPGRNPRGHQRRSLSKSKVKTIKMTLTVVLCYLVCWAPFYVGQLLSIFEVVNYQVNFMVVVMLLASLNSCTNPWIYLAFSGRICPKKPIRRTSKSWGPSTHLTSGGEVLESRSSASFLDMAHTRPTLTSRQGSHRCAGSGQQSSNC